MKDEYHDIRVVNFTTGKIDYSLTRDLRQYQSQTFIRMMLGALTILIVLGDGLIFFFYGKQAAIIGLLCIFGGLAPILFIGLILKFFDWIIKRNNGGRL